MLVESSFVSGKNFHGSDTVECISDVYWWRQDIVDPETKKLANELIDEIEIALRVIGRSSPSEDEAAAMIERRTAMSKLLEHDKRVRHASRRCNALETNVVNKIETHLNVARELESGRN